MFPHNPDDQTNWPPAKSEQHIAALNFRLALASRFLSAVADRFSLWGASGDPGVAGAIGTTFSTT